MSYSFNIRAASKAAAKEAVAAKLDEVVATQSSHKLDRDHALAAASAFIDAIADDDSKDVDVSVGGSVSWSGDLAADYVFVGAAVSVSAYLVTRGD